MNRTHSTSLSLLALALLSVPVVAQQPTGKIHGKVTDPTGMPVTVGTVLLTKDPHGTAKYTLPVDASGNYKGDNIAPDTYILVFRKPDTPPDKLLDELMNIKIVADQDLALDDDMSRKEYLDKLTPEQRKQIEEFKSKNAEIVKSNSVVKNLNADLTAARADNHDKKYADAEALMQKDIALKPDAAVLYIELGISQLGEKKYEDAATAFQKALDLNTASGKPTPELSGIALSNLGEIYARTSKVPDAQAAYDKAAAANPPGASQYYFNEAVVFFQVGNGDAQVAAADKAITTGAPNPKPILYYLKAQGLTQKATVDAKTNAIVLPPGTVDAYKKYLELDPNGQFASDSQQVLLSAGQKIETKYKAGKNN